MKKISHLLLLTIFLASCSSAVTPATPTLTVTNTPAPTATLTLTPTPQPTPTETPDPNMPADATGEKTVDGKKVYIKESEGRTYEWIKEEIKMVNGETLVYENWCKVVTKGMKKENGEFVEPMYLIPKDSHAGPALTPNLLPMTVLVQDEVDFNATIYANDVSKIPVDKKIATFPNRLFVDIFWKKYYEDNKATWDWEAVKAKVNAGALSVPITGLGEFEIGNEYRVIVLDKNTIIKGKSVSESPLFRKWKGLWGEYFYSLVGMDADGKLIHIVASANPFESLNRRQKSAMLLVPIVSLFKDPDLSSFKTNGMDIDLQYSEWLYRGDKSVPFIAIEPEP